MARKLRKDGRKSRKPGPKRQYRRGGSKRRKTGTFKIPKFHLG